MENKELLEENLDRITCPMEHTMKLIAGKWKLVILWHIYDNKIIRYGELKRCLNNITHKMLSNKLKELVSDDIIHKEIYPQIPPKVEYSLTEHGKSLIPIIDMMFEWGEKSINRIIKKELPKN